MRTNLLAFILSSENRKKIAKALFEYPKRQWSCSSLEEITKTSHATAFRTLKGLQYYGILKSVKLNRKDLIYEIVSSSMTKELKRILYLEELSARRIVLQFVKKIKSKSIHSVLLYGSSAKGTMRPESDIDVLVVMKKRDAKAEKKIFDTAAEISTKINKAISASVMDIRVLQKEKEGKFIKSIKEEPHEVLYGRKPF